MWIIPKTYKLSSAFAQDMVESKEDLILLESSIESSLMWRSKPSQLRTWSQRWKRESWLRHLFGRTLKPSQHTSFETALTSSLEGIRVNRLARQENDSGKTTQDTSGLTSVSQLTLFDQAGYSSRTSMDTSAWGFEKSCPIWKEKVTAKRGEYSARLKLARLTREKESLSWPTPAARDFKGARGKAAQARKGNPSDTLPNAMLDPKMNWPTPDVAQAQKVSNRPNHGQLGLANHPEVHGKACNREPMKKDRAGQRGQVKPNTDGKPQEQFGVLNPAWVEHLMGVPSGWTQIEWTESDSSETE